ncbi:MAG: DmpA family aminopeptidase [Candidatus Saccharicenans sp.]|uniref:DmpA family aminopeptidase n=1 Tax=Candidatus Saccharicenans sp. TaxID=2819258 RepID=UPI00404B4992
MKITAIFFLVPYFLVLSGLYAGESRPRVREFGLKIGVLEPGPLNAITDVAGVRVGHRTLIEGDSIRTGVTAIIPHSGNIFQEKVPAGIYVANGFGKLMGYTQVEELGYLETPIILTNTLSVPEAASAVIDYILSLPGNEQVQSVNPVVGETNDGWLNDIRARAVKKEHVLEAIRAATEGPVEEGSVGAGTGTTCFSFKGGIGTASRKLPESRGGWTVGILVQTNFGGVLQIKGLAVEELLKRESPADRSQVRVQENGSCLIVVATDAPLDSRNLKRLAKRALLGIARTGGYYSNGSGDYAVAFSTAPQVRLQAGQRSLTQNIEIVRNEAMSALFQAAAETAEEAILNSLFKATAVTGKDGHRSEPLPLNRLKSWLEKFRDE